MSKETPPVLSVIQHPEPFSEYLDLLVRYHGAMALGERQLANHIREEMFGPFEELDKEEIDWLDEVSGDLYLLYGKETFVSSELTQTEIVEKLRIAQEQRDAETMLKLLRLSPDFSEVSRAHFRANAYIMLGFPRLALMFRAFANEKVEGREDYGVLLLNDLWRFNLPHLAQEYASTLLTAGSPKVQIFSAMILFAMARTLSSEVALPLVKNTIEVLSHLENTRSFADLPKKLKVGLFMTLGSCFTYLGEEINARQAYDRGLAYTPHNDFLLVLRGRLMLESEPMAALSDFREAIRLKTTVDFPYLILARDAMVAKDYRNGMKLSHAAVQHASNDRVRAQAMEFIAICEYEAGRPLEKVLSRFDYAQRLDPENVVFPQNKEAILRAAGEGARHANSANEAAKYQKLSPVFAPADKTEMVSQSIINYINISFRLNDAEKRSVDRGMQSQLTATY